MIMLKRLVSLPLQSKVTLLLLLAITLFASLAFISLQVFIRPAFDDLELRSARADLVRAEQALETEVANLAYVTTDWAHWNDLHDYANGLNPRFVPSSLVEGSLINLDLDFLAVDAIDPDQDWSYLLVDGERHPTAQLGILEPGDNRAERLLNHVEEDAVIAGVILTDLGPAVIASIPILRSNDRGPMAGTIVMGQFLDPARLQRLRDRTEVNMNWILATEFDPPEESIGREGARTLALGEDFVSGNSIVTDIFGDELLVLQTRTSRDIHRLGHKALTATLFWLGAVGSLLTIFIGYLLQRVVLEPIKALEGHISELRRSGDLSKKVSMNRSDEVGRLALRFDELTTEVHEARQALLDQSFKAGKADTAAEVLHNIRNAMTPLAHGLDRLAKRMKAPSKLRVEEAVSQLADDECPAERRAKLLQYIDASFQYLKQSGTDTNEDLEIVRLQAHQVEEILVEQERFSSVAPITEIVQLDKLVREASHVIPKASAGEICVSSDARLGDLHVTAHRVGLLQVLGNLLLNAYEAIERHRREGGKIELTAREEVFEDRPVVRLTIQDNGCGFDEATSKKIFQRGFSAKNESEFCGLGLHWCANAIAGMGGRIIAESEGIGRGAHVHVLLPAANGGIA